MHVTGSGYGINFAESVILTDWHPGLYNNRCRQQSDRISYISREMQWHFSHGKSSFRILEKGDQQINLSFTHIVFGLPSEMVTENYMIIFL